MNCHNCTHHTDHKTESQLIICNENEGKEPVTMTGLDIDAIAGACPRFEVEKE